MSDRQEAEKLFLEHLDRLERIIASVCRRHGLGGDDAEDFGGWVKLKLVEDDYAALRKYRGESAFPTYLALVVAMLFRDYRVRERGRWRPSAAARRLGGVVVRLETLVRRDELSLDQAAQVLRSTGETDLSDRALADLLGRLPERSPLRPTEAAPGGLESAVAEESADRLALADQIDREWRETERALMRSLEGLPDEDRLIVRMKVWEDRTVADISRTLGVPQKPLYRRLERVFVKLRHEMEAAGITREQVRSVLLQEDEDFAVETEPVTPNDPHFEAAMQAFEEVRSQYRDTLRKLAE